MGLITLENFKKSMDWLSVEFTGYQMETIHRTIQTEYKTFNELDVEFDLLEEEKNYFCDVNIDSIMEDLEDLEDAYIIHSVLTHPYGYNGTSATIYYLSEDETYCLVFH